MTPNQQLRRWVMRARRAFVGPGADHEPMVEVEAGSAASIPPRARRVKRQSKITQFASAFLLTVSLIAIVVAVGSARLAEIRPDWSPAAEPTTGAPYAIAAAGAALSLVRAEDAYRDGLSLMPGRRKARMRAFQIGAASAVAAFATVTDERRRRSDPDLAAAAAELSALAAEPDADFSDLQAGRDALARFGDRIANGRARFDPGPEGLAGLALACQAAAIAHTAELAGIVQHGGAWIATADGEASFFRARGEVYGWRLVLSAYGRDMTPEARARAEPALSELIAASEDAANYQPLFLLNGPQQSAAAPNHLAHLAVKLTLVSAAAERLADAARSQPGPPA